MAFRIKPHSCRDAQRVQTNLMCTRTQRPHRDWAELCLSVSCGGTGHQWTATGAEALGAADLSMTWVRLEKVAINPTTQLPELTQDWGNRLLEGTNRTLCAPGERSRDTTRDWPRLARECPGVSGRGVGWWWSGAGLGALRVAVSTWDLWKKVVIILITSTRVSVPFYSDQSLSHVRLFATP